MKIIILPLALLGLLAPPVHADETTTAETPQTWLFVRTTPPGAKVFLDGEQLGTSTDLFGVEPGVRKLVVRLEGRSPQARKITIRLGEVTRVLLDFGPPRENGTTATAVTTAPPPEGADAQEFAKAALRESGAKVEFHPSGAIRSISWCGPKVKDIQMVTLKNVARGLTDLEELDLSGAQVGDAGLKYLPSLAKLKSLDLSGTRVSDAGLEHLKGLTNLERLDLARTQVGDGGLSHLDGLKRLRRVGLRDTRVSPFAISNWALGSRADRSKREVKVSLVEARGKGEKSVLDLGTGQTLALSREAHRDPGVFTRLGKGDLWLAGDKIVCLRGAKAVNLGHIDYVFPGEEVDKENPDVTRCRLRQTIRDHYVRLGKIGGPPIRFSVTTREKKHFYVEISTVTKDGDLLLTYESVHNPFNAKEDPRFRMKLADHEALDLDTGDRQSFSPWQPENWPDAFELVHDEGRLVCKRDTRVIELKRVKSFQEATEQAISEFDELAEGETYRGDIHVLERPDGGPSRARYFAFITNREHLAVVEVAPPKADKRDAGIASIQWSIADIGARARGVPPLLGPVHRLPAPLPLPRR